MDHNYRQWIGRQLNKRQWPLSVIGLSADSGLYADTRLYRLLGIESVSGLSADMEM